MGHSSGRIALALTARIRAGEYAPGARLPPHRVLLREFAVSPVTLQVAMSQLAADGLVEARGRHGTFVAEHPANRQRCALVFPDDPRERLRHDWQELVRVAGGWRDADGWSCTAQLWTGDDGALLRRRLAARAYAGVVLVQDERGGWPDPPATLRHAPLVALAGALPGVPPPRASLVVPGFEPAVERTCAAFAAAGRRRLGVVMRSLRPADLASVPAAGHRHGLEVRGEWCIGLPQLAAVRSVVHLLCTGRPSERPDCLLLLGHGFAEPGTAGVADAGLRVPDDVQVASHAPDPAALLAAMVAEVRRLAAGGRPAEVGAPV